MSCPFFSSKIRQGQLRWRCCSCKRNGPGLCFCFLCNKYQFKPSTSATQETISHQPAPTPFRHDFPPVPSPSSNRRSKVASHSSCNKFQFDAVCDVFSQCAFFFFSILGTPTTSRIFLVLGGEKCGPRSATNRRALFFTCECGKGKIGIRGKTVRERGLKRRKVWRLKYFFLMFEEFVKFKNNISRLDINLKFKKQMYRNSNFTQKKEHISAVSKEQRPPKRPWSRPLPGSGIFALLSPGSCQKETSVQGTCVARVAAHILRSCCCYCLTF